MLSSRMAFGFDAETGWIAGMSSVILGMGNNFDRVLELRRHPIDIPFAGMRRRRNGGYIAHGLTGAKVMNSGSDTSIPTDNQRWPAIVMHEYGFARRTRIDFEDADVGVFEDQAPAGARRSAMAAVRSAARASCLCSVSFVPILVR